jgi:hypothetical protein
MLSVLVDVSKLDSTLGAAPATSESTSIEVVGAFPDTSDTVCASELIISDDRDTDTKSIPASVSLRRIGAVFRSLRGLTLTT